MFKKTLTLILTFVMTTQVVLGSVGEANFWAERRKAINNHPSEEPTQVASLPASMNPSSIASQDFLKTLPTLSPQLSASNKWMKTNARSQKKLSLAMQTLLDSIPQNAVTVQDVYDGGDPSLSPLLLVQDVHLNFEAQSNIAALLQNLINQKKVGFIGIEGAFTTFDFNSLRNVPDKKLVHDVAKEFLRGNRIAAHNFVGITSESDIPPMAGVDNPAHYEANVEAYLEAQDIREKTRRTLEILRLQVAQEKSKVFSLDLKNFDDLKMAYNAGSLGFGAYVRKLRSSSSNVLVEDPSNMDSRLRPVSTIKNYRRDSPSHNDHSEVGRGNDGFAIDQFLEAYGMELTLDFKRVEEERQAVLEKLTRTLTEKEISGLLAQSMAYRMGRLGFGDYYRNLKDLCGAKGISLRKYDHFDSYIRYVLLADGIQSEKLFGAIEALEDNLGRTLAQTPEEKNLLNRSDYLNLAGKLINFELTPNDWKKFKSLSKEYGVLGIESKENKLFSSSNSLQITHYSLLKPFKKFYEEADARSSLMIDRLLSIKEPSPRGRGEGVRGHVLVSGGYHTPELAEILKSKKMSYVVVSPKLTKIDEKGGSAYLSVFAREKTPLEKLFSGHKLFISPASVTDPFSFPSPEQMGPNITRQLKIARTAEDDFKGMIGESPSGLSYFPNNKRYSQGYGVWLESLQVALQMGVGAYLILTRGLAEGHSMLTIFILPSVISTIIWLAFHKLMDAYQLRRNGTLPLMKRQYLMMTVGALLLNMIPWLILRIALPGLEWVPLDHKILPFLFPTFIYFLVHGVLHQVWNDVTRPSWWLSYAPSKPIRILYVEDRNDVRSMTSAVFSAMNYHVVEAVSYEDALQKLQDEQGQFDFVISDVEMQPRPEKGHRETSEEDGVKLYHAIAKDYPHLQSRFIMLAAYDIQAIRAAGVPETVPFVSKEPKTGEPSHIVQLMTIMETKTNETAATGEPSSVEEPANPRKGDRFAPDESHSASSLILRFTKKLFPNLNYDRWAVRSLLVPFVLEVIGMPGLGWALMPGLAFLGPMMGPALSILFAGLLFSLAHGLPGRGQSWSQFAVRSIVSVGINALAFSPVFFVASPHHWYWILQQYLTAAILHGLWNTGPWKDWRLSAAQKKSGGKKGSDKNSKELVLDLDPSWKIRRSVGKDSNLKPDEKIALQNVLSDIELYASDIPIRHIQIRETADGYIGSNLETHTLQLGKGSFVNSEVLKFSLLQGLTELQIDQSILKRSLDRNLRVKAENRKERLMNISELKTPFAIIMNGVLMYHEAESMVPKAIRDVMVRIRWVNLYDALTTVEGVAQKLSTSLPNRNLVEFLKRASAKPIEDQILMAAEELPSPQGLPWFLPEKFRPSQTPIRLMTQSEYEQAARSNTSQYLEAGIRNKGIESCVWMLGKAYSEDDLRLIRALDFISLVKIKNKYIPVISLGGVEKLNGVLGPDLLGGLRSWYSHVWGAFVAVAHRRDDLIQLLGKLGENVFTPLLEGHMPSIAAMFKNENGVGPSIPQYEFLTAAFGDDTVRESIQRSGEKYFEIGSRFDNYDEWNGTLSLFNELRTSAAWPAIKTQFINDPYVCVQMVSMIFTKLNPNEIFQIPKNSGRPGVPLSLNTLLHFDQWNKALSDRLGADSAERLFERKPLEYLLLLVLFEREKISLEDLDSIISRFGKENFTAFLLTTSWMLDDMVTILSNFNTRILPIIPAPLLLEVLARGREHYIGHIIVGDLMSHLDGETYLTGLCETLFHLDWIDKSELRRLINSNSHNLGRLIQSVYAMTPYDVTGMSEDSNPENFRYWERWETLIDVIGKENVGQLYQRDPNAFVDFLERIAKDENYDLEMLRTIHTQVGSPLFMNMILADPKLMGASEWMTRLESADWASVVQFGVLIWGAEELPRHPEWVLTTAGVFMRMGELYFNGRTKIVTEILNGTRAGPVAKMSAEDNKSMIQIAVQGDPTATLASLRTSEWWRALDVLCSVFSPGNILHLFKNSYSELIVGGQVFMGDLMREEPSTDYLGGPLQELAALFHWTPNDRDRIFKSSFGEMMRLSRQWKADLLELKSKNINEMEKWGEAGIRFHKLVGKYSSVVPVLCKAVLSSTLPENMTQFIHNFLLPELVHASTSGTKSKTETHERLEDAQFAFDLSREGWVEEGEALRLWLMLFYRNSLPIDRNGFKNGSTHQEIILQQQVLNNRELSSQLIHHLLLSDTNEDSFKLSLRIAVFVPDLFKSALEQASEGRRDLLQSLSPTALTENTFNCLRYSPSNRRNPNLMISFLAEDLLMPGDSLPQNRNYQNLAGGFGNDFTSRVQTYELTSVPGLISQMKVLGLEPPSISVFKSQLDPAIIVRLAVYKLDLMQTTSVDRGQLSASLRENSRIKEYLVNTIGAGVRDDERSETRFQDCVRLACLDSNGGRELLGRIQSQLPEDKDRKTLIQDALNAVLENNMNSILSSHADLVLNYPLGEGLVPLESKIGHSTPVTLNSIRQSLDQLGIALTNNTIQEKMNPHLFRAWNGFVVPRLRVLQRAYRGSRAVDDDQARYITKSISVAARYAWGGGELASGSGDRVIHEWSFPVLMEDLALIETKVHGEVEMAGPNDQKYVLSVENNRLNVFRGAKSSKEKPTLFARLLLDFVAAHDKDPLAQVEIPVEGQTKLMVIPSEKSGEEPFLFQVGQIDGRLFIVRIDKNVALANYFEKSPSREAYVRKISTEGRADLEVARDMIRHQVAESDLVEELLTAVNSFLASRDVPHAEWALRVMQSSLNDLFAKEGKSQDQQIPVGLNQRYSNRIFGPLDNLVNETIENPLDAKSLKTVQKNLARNSTVLWLQKEKSDVSGSFEEYSGRFLIDPYHSFLENHRTLSNRFISLLKVDAHPAALIRTMFDRGDLDYFLGGLTSLRGIPQSNRFHRGLTAEEHTLRAVEKIEQLLNEHQSISPERRVELYLLALFHDTGKDFGQSRGHTARSVKIMKEFLEETKAPQAIVNRLSRLIEVHQALGSISASVVRRVASGRTEELNSPEFQQRQQERIQTLAKFLSDGVDKKTALQNLEDLYLLTIADAAAIPFEEGDTGNRYTTLFAKHLSESKEKVKNEILRSQMRGGDAAPRSESPKPFSLLQYAGAGLISFGLAGIISVPTLVWMSHTDVLSYWLLIPTALLLPIVFLWMIPIGWTGGLALLAWSLAPKFDQKDEGVWARITEWAGENHVKVLDEPTDRPWKLATSDPATGEVRFARWFLSDGSNHIVFDYLRVAILSAVLAHEAARLEGKNTFLLFLLRPFRQISGSAEEVQRKARKTLSGKSEQKEGSNEVGFEAVIQYTDTTGLVIRPNSTEEQSQAKIFDQQYTTSRVNDQIDAKPWLKPYVIMDKEVGESIGGRNPLSLTFLDLGCGNGDSGSILYAQRGFGRYIGVDFSKVAIDQFKKRLEILPSGVELRPSDILAALQSMPEQSVDIIHAHLSLHYMDHETTQLIFKEMKRVLRADGTLVLKVLSDKDTRDKTDWKEIEPGFYELPDKKQIHLFSKSYLEKTLAQAGFEFRLWPVHVDGFFNEPLAAIAQKSPLSGAKNRRHFINVLGIGSIVTAVAPFLLRGAESTNKPTGNPPANPPVVKNTKPQIVYDDPLLEEVSSLIETAVSTYYDKLQESINAGKIPDQLALINQYINPVVGQIVDRHVRDIPELRSLPHSYDIWDVFNRLSDWYERSEHGKFFMVQSIKVEVGKQLVGVVSFQLADRAPIPAEVRLKGEMGGAVKVVGLTKIRIPMFIAGIGKEDVFEQGGLTTVYRNQKLTLVNVDLQRTRLGHIWDKEVKPYLNETEDTLRAKAEKAPDEKTFDHFYHVLLYRKQYGHLFTLSRSDFIEAALPLQLDEVVTHETRHQRQRSEPLLPSNSSLSKSDVEAIKEMDAQFSSMIDGAVPFNSFLEARDWAGQKSYFQIAGKNIVLSIIYHFGNVATKYKGPDWKEPKGMNGRQLARYYFLELSRLDSNQLKEVVRGAHAGVLRDLKDNAAQQPQKAPGSAAPATTNQNGKLPANSAVSGGLLVGMWRLINVGLKPVGRQMTMEDYRRHAFWIENVMAYVLSGVIYSLFLLVTAHSLSGFHFITFNILAWSLFTFAHVVDYFYYKFLRKSERGPPAINMMWAGFISVSGILTGFTAVHQVLPLAVAIMTPFLVHLLVNLRRSQNPSRLRRFVRFSLVSALSMGVLIGAEAGLYLHRTYLHMRNDPAFSQFFAKTKISVQPDTHIILDAASERHLREIFRSGNTHHDITIEKARQLLQRFSPDKQLTLLDNLTWNEPDLENFLSLLYMLETGGGAHYGYSSFTAHDADQMWKILSGEPYQFMKLLQDFKSGTGPTQLKLDDHEPLFLLLIHVGTANVSQDIKTDFLRGLKRFGRVNRVWPHDFFAAHTEYEKVKGITDPVQRELATFFVVNYCSDIPHGLAWEPITIILEIFGGVPKIAEEMGRNPDLPETISIMKHKLADLLVDAPVQNITFMNEWSPEKLSRFMSGVDSLAATGIPRKNIGAALMLISRHKGLPLDSETPWKIMDPGSLKKLIDGWCGAFLEKKGNRFRIQGTEDLKTLSDVWRALFLLGKDDQIADQIDFSGSGFPLSYVLKGSKDVSPLYNQSVVNALKPKYDKLPLTIGELHYGVDLINAVGDWRDLKTFYDADKSFNRYLGYRKSVGPTQRKKLMELCDTLNWYDFPTIGFLYSEYLVEDSQYAGDLLERFIRTTIKDSIQMEDLSSIESQAQKINEIDPIMGDQFIIMTGRQFMNQNPPSWDAMETYLKLTRSWMNPGVDRDRREIYQLVGNFIGNEACEFLLKDQDQKRAQPYLSAYKKLGIDLPEPGKSLTSKVSTAVKKTAQNIIIGNTSYLKSKLAVGTRNLPGTMWVQANDEWNLPAGFQVMNVNVGTQKAATLLLADSSKGARGGILFDVGNRFGGISTGDFDRLGPVGPMVFHFPLSFMGEGSKPTDLAIVNGLTENYIMSLNRQTGLFIRYPDGTMHLANKHHLFLSELYADKKSMKGSDRLLNLRKIGDYTLFMAIAREQKLSLGSNMLLFDGRIGYSVNLQDGSSTRRLLLQFSDGRLGILYTALHVSTGLATKIAVDLGAQMVIYTDTGGYDRSVLATKNKGQVVWGTTGNPFAVNQVFWYQAENAPKKSVNSVPPNSAVSYFTDNKKIQWIGAAVEMALLGGTMMWGMANQFIGAIIIVIAAHMIGWTWAYFHGRAPPLRNAVAVHGLMFLVLYAGSFSLVTHYHWSTLINICFYAVPLIVHFVGDYFLIERSAWPSLEEEFHSAVRSQRPSRFETLFLHCRTDKDYQKAADILLSLISHIAYLPLLMKAADALADLIEDHQDLDKSKIGDVLAEAGERVRQGGFPTEGNRLINLADQLRPALDRTRMLLTAVRMVTRLAVPVRNMTPAEADKIARSFGVSEELARRAHHYLRTHEQDETISELDSQIEQNLKELSAAPLPDQPRLFVTRVFDPYLSLVELSVHLKRPLTHRLDQPVAAAYADIFAPREGRHPIRSMAQSFHPSELSPDEYLAINRQLAEKGFLRIIYGTMMGNLYEIASRVPIRAANLHDVLLVNDIGIDLRDTMGGVAMRSFPDVIVFLNKAEDWATRYFTDRYLDEVVETLRANGHSVPDHFKQIMTELRDRDFQGDGSNERMMKIIWDIAVHELKHKYDEKNGSIYKSRANAELTAELTMIILGRCPHFWLFFNIRSAVEHNDMARFLPWFSLGKEAVQRSVNESGTFIQSQAWLRQDHNGDQLPKLPTLTVEFAQAIKKLDEKLPASLGVARYRSALRSGKVQIIDGIPTVTNQTGKITANTAAANIFKLAGIIALLVKSLVVGEPSQAAGVSEPKWPLEGVESYQTSGRTEFGAVGWIINKNVLNDPQDWARIKEKVLAEAATNGKPVAFEMVVHGEPFVIKADPTNRSIAYIGWNLASQSFGALTEAEADALVQWDNEFRIDSIRKNEINRQRDLRRKEAEKKSEKFVGQLFLMVIGVVVGLFLVFGKKPKRIESDTKNDSKPSLILPLWNKIFPNLDTEQGFVRTVLIPILELPGLPGFTMALNVILPLSWAILFGGLLFALAHGVPSTSPSQGFRQSWPQFFIRLAASVSILFVVFQPDLISSLLNHFSISSFDGILQWIQANPWKSAGIFHGLWNGGPWKSVRLSIASAHSADKVDTAVHKKIESFLLSEAFHSFLKTFHGEEDNYRGEEVIALSQDLPPAMKDILAKLVERAGGNYNIMRALTADLNNELVKFGFYLYPVSTDAYTINRIENVEVFEGPEGQRSQFISIDRIDRLPFVNDALAIKTDSGESLVFLDQMRKVYLEGRLIPILNETLGSSIHVELPPEFSALAKQIVEKDLAEILNAGELAEFKSQGMKSHPSIIKKITVAFVRASALHELTHDWAKQSPQNETQTYLNELRWGPMRRLLLVQIMGFMMRQEHIGGKYASAGQDILTDLAQGLGVPFDSTLDSGVGHSASEFEPLLKAILNSSKDQIDSILDQSVQSFSGYTVTDALKPINTNGESIAPRGKGVDSAQGMNSQEPLFLQAIRREASRGLPGQSASNVAKMEKKIQELRQYFPDFHPALEAFFREALLNPAIEKGDFNKLSFLKNMSGQNIEMARFGLMAWFSALPRRAQLGFIGNQVEANVRKLQFFGQMDHFRQYVESLNFDQIRQMQKTLNVDLLTVMRMIQTDRRILRGLKGPLSPRLVYSLVLPFAIIFGGLLSLLMLGVLPVSFWWLLPIFWIAVSQTTIYMIQTILKVKPGVLGDPLTKEVLSRSVRGVPIKSEITSKMEALGIRLSEYGKEFEYQNEGGGIKIQVINKKTVEGVTRFLTSSENIDHCLALQNYNSWSLPAYLSDDSIMLAEITIDNKVVGQMWMVAAVENGLPVLTVNSFEFNQKGSLNIEKLMPEAIKALRDIAKRGGFTKIYVGTTGFGRAYLNQKYQQGKSWAPIYKVHDSRAGYKYYFDAYYLRLFHIKKVFDRDYIYVKKKGLLHRVSYLAKAMIEILKFRASAMVAAKAFWESFLYPDNFWEIPLVKDLEVSSPLVSLIKNNKDHLEELQRKLLLIFSVKAEPLKLGEVVGRTQEEADAAAENIVRAFGQALAEEISRGDLKVEEARAMIAPLALALSVVYTPEEYRGFIGQIHELINTKEMATPADIVEFPSSVQEAMGIIQMAVGENNELKPGYRLALCLTPETAPIQTALQRQLPPALYGQIAFITKNKQTHAVEILRQLEVLKPLPDNSGARVRRFFVSGNIRLADDFFDLSLAAVKITPEELRDLSSSMHVYLIDQLMAVIEIPQTHLPRWETYRKILEAA